jgi:BON domain-containing protein
MNERNRRGNERQRGDQRERGGPGQRYGQDQPWREEHRHRYPDEPYGGPRSRNFADDRQSYRGRGSESNQNWRADDSMGSDYRGDFGPESNRDNWGRGYGYGFGDSGDYRNSSRGGRWEEGSRPEERGWGGWNTNQDSGGWRDHNRSGPSFGFGPEEVNRGSGYGYGSPYGQGDMNTDRAGRGDWQDSDWAANRPARGRGAWAGDWSTGRTAGTGETYAGRGPKDYRRSDDRIREEICDIFTDDPRLDPGDVTVKVENGDVTLMGTVSTRDQKRQAEELAERISGVRDVSNQLRVSRGETTSGTTAAQNTGRSGRGVAADRER